MTERLLTCLLLALLGCAADPKPPASDGAAAASGDSASPGGFASSQTVGGLDPDAVKAVVDRIGGEIDRCVEQGRKRVPMLGGEVGLSLTVNAMGRAESAFVSHSTLGDHAVERCIVDAFAAKQWPRPVGGKIGKIDQRFEFDSDAELSSWESADLKRAMAAEEDGEGAFEELKNKLAGCGQEAGAPQLAITMYLDEDGIAQAAGLSSPDGSASRAAACVDTVVKTTSFPAPGRGVVKVTVAVP